MSHVTNEMSSKLLENTVTTNISTSRNAKSKVLTQKRRCVYAQKEFVQKMLGESDDVINRHVTEKANKT